MNTARKTSELTQVEIDVLIKNHGDGFAMMTKALEIGWIDEGWIEPLSATVLRAAKYIRDHTN